jgi:hypothetical protein
MNRGATAGSAAGSALVVLLLFRSFAPMPVPERNPAQRGSIPTQAATFQRMALSPSEATHIRRPKEGPWKASQEHFAGLNGKECPAAADRLAPKDIAPLGPAILRLQGEAQVNAVTNPRELLWCIPSAEKVRAMIAIVPDPVQTHMALQFDRSVEAIQLAAESLDYVIDRYWLPWDARPKTELADSSQAVTLEDLEKQKEPALLMFRWDGAANQGPVNTLYVFLVGDTSTAGINGAQFSKAADYVDQLCVGTGCGSKKDRVWIIGPTFSGSLSSLRRLTDARSNSAFTAYSGSISSVCAVEKQGLQTYPQMCPQPLPVAVSPAPKLVFHSLVYDTESAVQSFIASLESKGEHPCRAPTSIAILSEAATTYGHTQRDLQREALPKSYPPAPSARHDDCYVSFSYPREISSLRNAYVGGESVAASEQSRDNGPLYLPFNLADRQYNISDEPPDFSRQQGPLSKEAVLMSFAAELRRDHFKYIGIAGSNVLDVLFLAGFLRKACPDVRLFVLNADLLFERDLDNAAYIGTLTLTTYPLIPTNHEWTSLPPSKDGQAAQDANPAILPRLPFADQYEEGQYNAGLLAMEGLMPELPPLDPYEFRKPFEAGPKSFDPECTLLPLWLTVVGNGGYWPIEIVPPNIPRSRDGTKGAGKDISGSEYKNRIPTKCLAGPLPAKSPLELQDADFSSAWKASVTILCALAGLHILLLTVALPLGSKFRDFSPIHADPGQRFLFVSLTTITMAVTLVMLITPLWRFPHVGKYLTFLQWTVPATVLLLIASCLIKVKDFFWAWKHQAEFGLKQEQGEAFSSRQRDPSATKPYHEASVFDEPWLRWIKTRRFWLTILYVTLWSVALLEIVCWWRLMHDDDFHYGFFFAYRSIHLTTGVSPFAPLLPLLLAVYYWGMCEIWRLRFHDQVRPRLEPGDNFPGASTEHAISASINHYFLRANYCIALTLVFLVWLLFLQPQHPFEIFEHLSFGIIYEVLFCLVVLLMLSAGFRLGQIWSDLKKLLAELDQSRVRLAFNQLKEYSWSPIWQSGIHEIEWTNITRSVEVLSQLKNAQEIDARLNEAIKSTEKKVEEYRDFRQRLESGKLRAKREDYFNVNRIFCEIQQLLSQVLRLVLQELEKYWNAPRYVPADDVHTGNDEKPVVVNCAPAHEDEPTQRLHWLEHYVAVRYVAFIRGVLGHVRRLIIMLTVLFSLVLLSLNIYSFEPHQSLIWSFTAIFAVIAFTIVVVLMQAYRDHVLSRITGTKPNQLGMDFYFKIVSFGAVPLLTLLATHFPAIGRYLLSFLQPGMEALK